MFRMLYFKYEVAIYNDRLHCWCILSEISQMLLATCSLLRQNRSHIKHQTTIMFTIGMNYEHVEDAVS